MKYEFQLLLPHGSALYLSCDDPAEREEWIETLNVVIAYLRLLTHPELAMVVNGYDPMNEDDEDVYKQGDEVAQNCQAYGPGLFGSEAGQQGQFVLEIHDTEGQPVRGCLSLARLAMMTACDGTGQPKRHLFRV